MEEHVIALLTLLIAPVAVDTQVPTVRTEVRIGTSRAYNHEGICRMVSMIMFGFL